MNYDQDSGGYSSTFWINKLINLAATLMSVWLIVWVSQEEQDPARSISKIILYILGFILASIAVWNAIKFIFNWNYDEARLEEEATGDDHSSVDEEQADDLTEIEGIGPKISNILGSAGYGSFYEISKADPEDIKNILEKAGDKYKMHDPASWPKQAKLAAKGRWADLHKLQEELDGGKETQ